MSVEIKIPSVGESVTEMEIADWLKKEGEDVEADQPVAVIETDKATVELPSPASGRLAKIAKRKGDKVQAGDVIGLIEEGESKAKEGKTPAKPVEKKKETASTKSHEEKAEAEDHPSKDEEEKPQEEEKEEQPAPKTTAKKKETAPVEKAKPEAKEPKEEAEERKPEEPSEKPAAPGPHAVSEAPERGEEVVRMSTLRRNIARRLVEAQQTAALLTTFNEIDMSAVMSLRQKFGEEFQRKHGVKLGFMSFFVRAVIDALKLVPQLNAEVRGDDVVFWNYHDIGVAVATDRGLVVPVLVGADRMSFAEIEIAIGDFAERAKSRRLKPEELHGGTFTISNGGVYGSLFSTPIVNPPQSGILGMHAIQERPVVREGQIVIRPMMYVALTYDHRIVDGREAVLFLKRVKEEIEKPERMLMEV